MVGRLAQRRYLEAIRTLAQLPHIVVPLPIQVNVAERQVSVAGVRMVA